MLGTGCSTGGMSLASMNPFSKSPEPGVLAPQEPSTTQKLTESIASTAGGARNQFSTMGTTVKSAWTKSTGAVTGLFGGGDDEVPQGSEPDPLRLDNMPQSVSPEVFVANGQLWESTGNFPKAMESYVKALESEPNNAPALTSIARLHFRQGNHQKAIEFFQKAISANPKDAGLHNDLGLTFSKIGNHAAAAQCLETALQISPGTSRYANNLASVKFESGDTNSAYKVLADNNKAAVAHFNMAYLHFKKGQLGEARNHLGHAVQFESQAGEDAAVKRAVDRSRDMLAQINGSISPIAQAAPQATVAALPSKAPIQQTSQSGTPAYAQGVATANQVAPPKQTPGNAWTTISSQPTAPKAPHVTPPATTPSAELPPAATAPTTPPPAATAPATGSPSAGSQGPSVPFGLPTGFQMPSGS